MSLEAYRAYPRPDNEDETVDTVSVPISYHEVEIPRGADSTRQVEIPKGHSIMPLVSEYQGVSDNGQTWKFRFMLIGPTE